MKKDQDIESEQPTSLDFTRMNTGELVQFVVEHQAEMDVEGLGAEDILAKLNSGEALIEPRPYGFAMIQVKRAPKGLIPHLWLLYLEPNKRGKGIGARFVKDLLQQFPMYHMSLYCHGSRRRKFFSRFGFRVESRDGEMRRMTTNPTP
jgi:GNAT superfamily N-acetyltransferase